jgi:thiamine biosynthesis lipoprotein
MKRVQVIIASLILSLMLTSCAFPGEKIYTSTIFAMDTIMELQISGKSDLTPMAEEYIRRLEKDLSVTDPESEIGRLNVDGEGELSEKTVSILEGALGVCDNTGGALDVTIYPVLKAWGFTTGEYRVPSDDEIITLLQNVDYSKVEISDGEHVTLADGMQLDLGSVVKGYTGTAVADMLRAEGVTHALLNLGGNVQCIGSKPNGDKWKVAIKSPFPDSSSGVFGVLAAEDVAIITSGGYERYFEQNGETYWHILDPHTGKPAKTGLASVTVVGKDGLLCDGLSTALFVKGLEEAAQYWKQNDDFDVILITEDGEVNISEGIAADFSLSGEYIGSKLTVLTR